MTHSPNAKIACGVLLVVFLSGFVSSFSLERGVQEWRDYDFDVSADRRQSVLLGDKSSVLRRRSNAFEKRENCVYECTANRRWRKVWCSGSDQVGPGAGDSEEERSRSRIRTGECCKFERCAGGKRVLCKRNRPVYTNKMCGATPCLALVKGKPHEISPGFGICFFTGDEISGDRCCRKCTNAGKWAKATVGNSKTACTKRA